MNPMILYAFFNVYFIVFYALFLMILMLQSKNLL